ncbi:helix-turn-helix transcriptional regulator [Entomomonas asaccharolytica]|uniref:AlpA family phage regulatory protein n=1 Tax=Entomomonas asaccharolytica TaxID=2785331 RepID=A0A974RWV8_9GAMM|nr:AlpA family phage regulatory protein [Entomomonas asaccharolytica]QQP85537.1 AlpA family phage regulatory protein [Entomomonas asaccharolytica]
MCTENKRLIRLAEVMSLTGLSRASVYNYIKAGTFPIQAKFGKSSLWEYKEIQQWINQRLEERNSNSNNSY